MNVKQLMALVTLHTKYFDAILVLLSQIIFAGFYFVLKKTAIISTGFIND